MYHIFVGAVVALLLGTSFVFYYQFAQYYKTHFMPGTRLGNLDVSKMTVAEVKQYTDNLSLKQKLFVVNRDGQEEIPLSSFGFAMSVSTDLQKFMDQQNPYMWLLTSVHPLEKKIPVEINATYNDKILKEKIHDLSMISGPNVKPPVDAAVVKGMDGYEIRPEDNGNTLDEKAVVAEIKDYLEKDEVIFSSLLQKHGISVDVVKYYKMPQVLKDDARLALLRDSANAYKDVVITIDCTDRMEELKFDTISSWFAVTKDAKGEILKPNKKGEVKISEKALKKYVRGLAKDTCTLHMTRSFKSHRGDRVDVQNDDDSFGFLLKENSMREELKKALKKKKSVDLMAVWNEDYEVPKCRNSRNGDIGNTYAEVSIDQQHMWLYKDGKEIFDTAIVTGKPFSDGKNELGEKTLTHTGVYFIFNKKTNHTMYGSYGSTHVNYWMQFTWDGEGFHDATWQSGFGGERYKEGHGSHGCVNISYDAAKELYDLIDYHTPVVVYQR